MQLFLDLMFLERSLSAASTTEDPGIGPRQRQQRSREAPGGVRRGAGGEGGAVAALDLGPAFSSLAGGILRALSQKRFSKSSTRSPVVRALAAVGTGVGSADAAAVRQLIAKARGMLSEAVHEAASRGEMNIKCFSSA